MNDHLRVCLAVFAIVLSVVDSASNGLNPGLGGGAALQGGGLPAAGTIPGAGGLPSAGASPGAGMAAQPSSPMQSSPNAMTQNSQTVQTRSSSSENWNNLEQSLLGPPPSGQSPPQIVPKQSPAGQSGASGSSSGDTNWNNLDQSLLGPPPSGQSPPQIVPKQSPAGQTGLASGDTNSQTVQTRSSSSENWNNLQQSLLEPPPAGQSQPQVPKSSGLRTGSGSSSAFGSPRIGSFGVSSATQEEFDVEFFGGYIGNTGDLRSICNTINGMLDVINRQIINKYPNNFGVFAVRQLTEAVRLKYAYYCRNEETKSLYAKYESKMTNHKEKVEQLKNSIIRMTVVVVQEIEKGNVELAKKHTYCVFDKLLKFHGLFPPDLAPYIYDKYMSFLKDTSDWIFDALGLVDYDEVKAGSKVCEMNEWMNVQPDFKSMAAAVVRMLGEVGKHVNL